MDIVYSSNLDLKVQKIKLAIADIQKEIVYYENKLDNRLKYKPKLDNSLNFDQKIQECALDLANIQAELIAFKIHLNDTKQQKSN